MFSMLSPANLPLSEFFSSVNFRSAKSRSVSHSDRGTIFPFASEVHWYWNLLWPI